MVKYIWNNISFLLNNHTFSVQLDFLDLPSHLFPKNIVHKLFHLLFALFKHFLLILLIWPFFLNWVSQSLTLVENGPYFIKLFWCFGLERFQILIEFDTNFLCFFGKTFWEQRFRLSDLIENELQVNWIPFETWTFWIDPHTKVSMFGHWRKALILWILLWLLLLVLINELFLLEGYFPSTEQAFGIDEMLIFIDDPSEESEEKWDLDLLAPVEFVGLIDGFESENVFGQILFNLLLVQDWVFLCLNDSVTTLLES